ncbi:MAG: hypothetical protein IIY88_00695 [Eubacterium sp.]|nr:hypothetical protein [Eubacterium sp.]
MMTTTTNRKHFARIIAMITIIFAIAAFGSASHAAKTVKSNVNASMLAAGKQFTLTDMPYNGAYSIIKTYNGKTVTPSGVQNFAFTPDGKYIMNASVCRISGKEHVLLTRCLLPETRNASASALCVDATVLYGYAHPEVLSITQPNKAVESYDLWVCSKPGKGYMGREITRLTYQVGANGKGRITKAVTITGFKKANVVDGKSSTFKGKKAPVSVTTSIDTASNQIMFRLRMPSGYGVVYVSYDFNNINNKLNALPNGGKFNIAKARNWQRAHIRCSIRPCDSLQSFEVIGNKLYLCGGHFNKGAQIYEIPFKFETAGKATEQFRDTKNISRIINITPELKVDGKTFRNNALEIEGMKVFRNASGRVDYYINFIAKGTGLRSTIGIHKFTF